MRSARPPRRNVREVLGNADPFIAQLIGLLGPLARIVLFRLTMETYREFPDIQPRAEVFIRAMQLQAPNVAGFIASTWELSDPSIRALQEQTDKIPPDTMSPLGQAIYFGELCGALTLLTKRGTYSEDRRAGFADGTRPDPARSPRKSLANKAVQPDSSRAGAPERSRDRTAVHCTS